MEGDDKKRESLKSKENGVGDIKTKMIYTVGWRRLSPKTEVVRMRESQRQQFTKYETIDRKQRKMIARKQLLDQTPL
jgi:hypothetical protein